MSLKWPEDFIGKVIQGDCLEVMRQIPFEVSCIITDPVWPNASVELHGSDDPHHALLRCMDEAQRITQSLIIHLGCDSDPRFLTAVPRSFPFVRVAWLRYARPGYKGRILMGSDTAYVFGRPRVPEGNHLLPGECTAVDSKFEKTGHPCSRRLEHLEWLISRFTRKDDVVLDPFAGAGTTLLAAERQGRSWVGIEFDPKYCAIARKRIATEQAQEKLF